MLCDVSSHASKALYFHLVEQGLFKVCFIVSSLIVFTGDITSLNGVEKALLTNHSHKMGLKAVIPRNKMKLSI